MNRMSRDKSRVQIMRTRSGDKVAFSGSGHVLSIMGNAVTGTGPNQTTVNLPKVTRTSSTLGAKAGIRPTFDNQKPGAKILRLEIVE